LFNVETHRCVRTSLRLASLTRIDGGRVYTRTGLVAACLFTVDAKMDIAPARVNTPIALSVHRVKASCFPIIGACFKGVDEAL